ncbi:hypothetical protein AVEN_118352-1 [Araneus ventricosus]|uniref:Uncharacterized protein n=1 Tax=Araneus ventricosus TaxID=182803 RepID=A0A4Y2B7N3_ARAVE|nr:hypothetical protein AVEN_118352-1 [Araneus ventricosus]
MAPEEMSYLISLERTTNNPPLVGWNSASIGHGPLSTVGRGHRRADGVGIVYILGKATDWLRLSESCIWSRGGLLALRGLRALGLVLL